MEPPPPRKKGKGRGNFGGRGGKRRRNKNKNRNNNKRARIERQQGRKGKRGKKGKPKTLRASKDELNAKAEAEEERKADAAFTRKQKKEEWKKARMGGEEDEFEEAGRYTNTYEGEVEYTKDMKKSLMEEDMGYEVEAFNMNEAREQGSFYANGMYSFRKRDPTETDAWLETVTEEVYIGKDGSGKEEQKDDTPIRPETDLWNELIPLLQEGESVTKAIKRLGGRKQSKTKTKDRFGVIETGTEDKPDPKAMESLIEVSNVLMMQYNHNNIFGVTQREAQVLLQQAEYRALQKEQPENVVQVQDDGRYWEYKYPDGKIFGPFGTSDMHAWKQQGYFAAEGTMVRQWTDWRAYMAEEQAKARKEAETKAKAAAAEKKKAESENSKNGFGADDLMADFEDSDDGEDSPASKSPSKPSPAPDSGKSTTPVFMDGDDIQIYGLKSEKGQKLNGLPGTVSGTVNANGRINVILTDPETFATVTKNVKPVNLLKQKYEWQSPDQALSSA